MADTSSRFPIIGSAVPALNEPLGRRTHEPELWHVGPSIVLIDGIYTVRAAGGEPYQAIIDAAITGWRPILMATVTTVLGLMPLIVSRDALFFSMAIVMAFGLLFGTLLTLGVVPVLYSVVFRIKQTR